MNNTFSFKRFKNLLLNDGKMYYRNFGIMLLLLCCLPVIFMITHLLFGGQTGTEFRYVFINFIAIIAMMVVPEKVYGKANLSREGIGFAMLPASSLEKFLSMFIYCAIVTPIIAILGSYLIDTLLSFLPFSGMDNRISLFSDEYYSSDIIDIRAGVTPYSYSQVKTYFDIYSIFHNLCFSAIFMLGNMVFKKHKTGKTIICILGASFVFFVCFFALFVRSEWFQGLVRNGNFNDEEQVIEAFSNYMGGGMIIGLVVLIVITIVLYFFTYRKIKTQKY
jgi:hypothetical protein